MADGWANWAGPGQNRGPAPFKAPAPPPRHGQPVNAWRPQHDPHNRELPHFARRIGDPGDPTVLVRDERDRRIISPFQHEHPFVIEINSNAGINRITEPGQVLTPNQGVYLTFYTVITTNTHKMTIACAFDVPEGIPCGLWDRPSATVLSHPAFQPFDWPEMTDQSPPYVDLKLKVGGKTLLHVIMKCYRARGDMTVQKFWTNETLVAICTEKDLQEVQVQHAVFAGFEI